MTLVSGLAKGTYTLVVSGKDLKNSTVGATGNITVSAVPLPAALPMFGAGLAGLGALARRRKANKAA